MDGIQHISTTVKILRSLQQDIDSCLLVATHLHHYAMRKLNISDTNQFVIINVRTLKFGVWFTLTENFKLFLVTDKSVTETNRDVGREESLTDVDGASEGDVQRSLRQAEMPLLSSDESMYILYIWSTIYILYFLLYTFTTVFSLFLSPLPPLLSLYPFLNAQYWVVRIYFVFLSVICCLDNFANSCIPPYVNISLLHSCLCTAEMLSHAYRTVYDCLRQQTIPSAYLRVSVVEIIRIYTVSVLSRPRTRQLSRDVSADAGLLCDGVIILTGTIK